MLNEKIDVTDDQGNIIISPDLKVRHTKSQYEYTVDNVVQDPDGTVNIILKLPEEPRFDPPGETTIIQDNKRAKKYLYEVDPSGLYIIDDEVDQESEPAENELISVTQDEFEKEYEVK